MVKLSRTFIALEFKRIFMNNLMTRFLKVFESSVPEILLVQYRAQLKLHHSQGV